LYILHQTIEKIITTTTTTTMFVQYTNQPFVHPWHHPCQPSSWVSMYLSCTQLLSLFAIVVKLVIWANDDLYPLTQLWGLASSTLFLTLFEIDHTITIIISNYFSSNNLGKKSTKYNLHYLIRVVSTWYIV